MQVPHISRAFASTRGNHTTKANISPTPKTNEEYVRLDKLICIGFVNKIDGVTYTTTLK
jgi:hypothetical protein